MEGVVAPSPSFWQGRRVFLTGHTGFKGTWISGWLRMMGASVMGYALAPEPDALYRDAEPLDEAHSHIADVRDAATLSAVMGEFRPEVVFHLAAQPLVLESYREPRETHDVNIMGTVNLMEAIRACPTVRSVVIVTTDKCYENVESQRPYRESDPLGGFDPYSASKAAVEIVVASYRSSFFGPEAHGEPHRAAVATARSGNVIGGGDFAADRLVPDLIRAGLEGRAAVVRNPDSIRPWQHVLEPTCGYLVLAERLFKSAAFADSWNFGPLESDCRPVRSVCEEVAKHMDGLALEFPEATGPHEAGVLRLDISKARERLGWQPRWSIEEAVEQTVRMYRDLARDAGTRRGDAAPGLLQACIRAFGRQTAQPPHPSPDGR